MSAKWKDEKKQNFNPDCIFDSFKRSAKLNRDKFHLDVFSLDINIPILASMLEVSHGIPEIQKEIFLRSSLLNINSLVDLNKDYILKLVQEKERSYLQQVEKKYILVTTISILNNIEIPKFKIEKSFITFSKSLPKKFLGSRNTILEKTSQWLIEKDRNDNLFVQVTTLARSDVEAAENCLKAIDFLRGIWNIKFNKSLSIIRNGGRKCLNTFTLGALHSLHHENGELISDYYWYQPDFDKNQTPFNLRQRNYLDVIATSTLNFRKKINKLKYNQLIINAIIQYSQALDYTDLNVSFIKLWSVLETLTNTLYDSYDVTIKRTIFLYEDSEYAEQVLLHLKNCRNRLVHVGNYESDIEPSLFLLSNFVRNLFNFHIFNKSNFKNISEVIEFLQLPGSLENLKTKKRIINEGIKYIKLKNNAVK